MALAPALKPFVLCRTKVKVKLPIAEIIITSTIKVYFFLVSNRVIKKKKAKPGKHFTDRSI